MRTELVNEHCQPLSKGSPALDGDSVAQLLKAVTDWDYAADQQTIARTFEFKNFYQTIAFVNMVAWIANQQDHHPDLQVSYKKCTVTYTTHSVNGLSRNDFICAAKIDALTANG